MAVPWRLLSKNERRLRISRPTAPVILHPEPPRARQRLCNQCLAVTRVEWRLRPQAGCMQVCSWWR